MRWAIGILLLANLAFALWQGVQPPPGGSQVALPEPDVGNLRLLSERELPRPGTAPAAAAAIPAEPQVLALPQPGAPEPPEAEASRLDVASPEPVAESPVEPQRPPEAAAVAVPAPAQPAPAPVPETVCWDVGQFADQEQAEAAQARLPIGISLLDIVESEVEQISGYYVLIPAAATHAEAKATVARLKENGISDTWLFTGGSLKYAISLGLFSKQSNASRYAERLRKKGFAVVVQEKIRISSVFRLRVRGADLGVNQRALKREFGEHVQQLACP